MAGRARVAERRTLPTVADTEALGRELAAGLRPGDLVVLDGPLGAGKTALTRGIAAGLGVEGRVSSPTFIIARQHRAGSHPGAVAMVHVDAYRLGGDLDELDALDLDTDLDDAVVVVEWGLGVVEHLTDRHLLVRLQREPDSDVRTAVWEWIGRPGFAAGGLRSW
jgi:tRNA threonylcarbamoyladenosine biosynthesis protein TsaE